MADLNRSQSSRKCGIMTKIIENPKNVVLDRRSDEGATQRTGHFMESSSGEQSNAEKCQSQIGQEGGVFLGVDHFRPSMGLEPFALIDIFL